MTTLDTLLLVASAAFVVASSLDAYSSRGMRELWPLNHWPVFSKTTTFNPWMYAAGSAVFLLVLWLWAQSWLGLAATLALSASRAYFGLVKNPKVRKKQAELDRAALDATNATTKRLLPMD